jgi:uncharacterized protein
MNERERWGLRLALLTEMVERSPSKLGRTAVMKLAYLLQTLKGVPLGYNFRLYTYGPFDEDVLNDLGQVVTMRGVKSTVVNYPGGYGYEFSLGPKSTQVKEFGESLLSKYIDNLEWALEGFAAKTASELELLSTIVYVDQDFAERERSVPETDLVNQVRQIKPHFSDEKVRQSIFELKTQSLLRTA